MITADQIKVIKDLTRQLTIYNMNVAKGAQQKPEWISYEQAFEILPNSKTWYREARNDKKILVQGKDWRRVGRIIQYNKESIINLNTFQ